MNKDPIPDLPVNTAIVVVAIAAMLVGARYAVRFSKGDTFEPHEPHQPPSQESQE